ncbi:MAG: antitoxin MazE-like protein [Rhodospirillaceae bacterium]|nr:antitoxin MazE-like protein [Rhodospirillaceae bacterium]
MATAARKKSARTQDKRAAAGKPRRAKTAAEKMRAFRARMRAKGFKLVQTWVPDTNDPAFIARVRRDVEALRGTPGEREAIAFIEAAAEDMDEWK